jgi:hypothetical protein
MPQLTCERVQFYSAADEAAFFRFAEGIAPDWEDGCFIVGRWMVGGPAGYAHHDWAWSLTKTHAELIAYVTRNKK